MTRVYKPVHIRFLSKHIRGKSYSDLATLFNKHFGLNQSVIGIKTICYKNGLQNGLLHRWQKKYTAEQIKYLESKVKGRKYKDLTELFNKKFGTSITRTGIMQQCWSNGLHNGLKIGFQKGHIPHNKGKKKWWKGGEETQFKPGQLPPSTRPVGDERINVCGYIEVKYQQKPGPVKNKWKSKHALIWEKTNGKIPKGHVVIFADGNKRNFDINNLLLVSRKELVVMNKKHLIYNHKNLTAVGKTIADLSIVIKKRKREMKKKRK
jgi:hypothetical protein